MVLAAFFYIAHLNILTKRKKDGCVKAPVQFTHRDHSLCFRGYIND